MRRLLLLTLLMVLTSCNNSTGTTASTPVDNDPIQWDRSPTAVVFRAEVRGGQYEDPFLSRNEIPPCTLYGDNHVVWTVEAGGGTTQVLVDIVSDARVREFVTYLVLERYYDYGSGFEGQTPSATMPVVETLTLFVNGVEKRTDMLGGLTIDFYQRMLTSCGNISNAPVLFEPEGGWISAQYAPYDPTAPLIVWEPETMGISFSELAGTGEVRWITGSTMLQIWMMLRQSVFDVRFDEGDNQFFVALQVPGITRNAPPNP
jgi:hypothetical protein